MEQILSCSAKKPKSPGSMPLRVKTSAWILLSAMMSRGGRYEMTLRMSLSRCPIDSLGVRSELSSAIACWR